MKDWTNFSRLISDLEPEIYYQISDNFFIGNPNEPSQFQEPHLNVRIDPPQIDSKIKGVITTKEAFNNEFQLSEYYKIILELKENYKKSYVDIQHLFWLRLWIGNSKQQTFVSFPWYDTMNEFKRFFRVFDDNKTGEIFYDIDQGWQLEIEADNDFYYIREVNPNDNNLIIQNIKTHKASLKNAIRELEKNINIEVKELTNLIGADLWTDREYLKEGVKTKKIKEINIKRHNRKQIKNIKKVSKKQKRVKKIINISVWVLLSLMTILMIRKLISWIIPAILLAYILIMDMVKNSKRKM